MRTFGERPDEPPSLEEYQVRPSINVLHWLYHLKAVDAATASAASAAVNTQKSLSVWCVNVNVSAHKFSALYGLLAPG